MLFLQARVSTLSCLVRRLSTKGSKKFPPAGDYRSPWKILQEEYDAVARPNPLPAEPTVPREVDALIIGGSLMGMSVAFWLKHLHPKALSVAVVERDPTYARASSMLSCGGVRHQFTIPESVQLSMFASEFLRDIKQYLSILDDKEPPDVQFNHQGYLFLESEQNAQHLADMVKMQNEMGAKIKLLTKNKLKEKFPWLNLNGIDVGSYGLQGEGWFDPWLLLKCLRQKNLSYGVKIINGELDSFTFRKETFPTRTGYKDKEFLDSAVINGNDGNEYGVKFSFVINCTGPWAGEIAKKARIGTGYEELQQSLPVSPRKRYVYVVNCRDGPGLETPFVIDPSGVYFRREGLGGNYICGASPSEENEPPIDDLSVDYSFFEEAVWPQLAYRVPKFENLKLKSAWAGYYDYNDFDQNLIVGPHPYFRNFVFANGLSGHGLQHSIGIGRAIAELIMDTQYKSIDLTKFSFNRLLVDEKLEEINIV